MTRLLKPIVAKVNILNCTHLGVRYGRRVACFLLSVCFALSSLSWGITAYADDISDVSSWISCGINQVSCGRGAGCTGCCSMMVLQNSRLLDSKYQFSEPGKRQVITSPSTKNSSGTAYSTFAEALVSTGSITSDGWYWAGSEPVTENTLTTLAGGKLHPVNNTDSGFSKGGNNAQCIVGLGGKDFRDMSDTELAEAFQTIWDAGYFAMVGTIGGTGGQSNFAGGYSAGHLVMYAGVAGGRVYIDDVWDGTVKDLINSYQGVQYVVLYKADGTSPVELAGGKVSVGSDITTNSDGSITVNGFLNETDFVPLRYTEEPIQVASFTDLNLTDRTAVRQWTSDTEETFGDKVLHTVRVCVSLIGILTVIYVTLLYVAYQFDRINTLVEIEFLPILTVGRLRVSPDEGKSTFRQDDSEDKDTKKSTKTVTHKDMIVVTLIGVTIGVLILTGKLYDIIAYLISFAKSKFG